MGPCSCQLFQFQLKFQLEFRCPLVPPAARVRVLEAGSGYQIVTIAMQQETKRKGGGTHESGEVNFEVWPTATATQWPIGPWMQTQGPPSHTYRPNDCTAPETGRGPGTGAKSAQALATS